MTLTNGRIPDMETFSKQHSTVGLVLEPITQAFLDSLAAAGGPPIEELSVEEARKQVSLGQASTLMKQPTSRTAPFWAVLRAKFQYVSSDQRTTRNFFR
jgi:hypothetical protein